MHVVAAMAEPGNTETHGFESFEHCRADDDYQMMTIELIYLPEFSLPKTVI